MVTEPEKIANQGTRLFTNFEAIKATKVAVPSAREAIKNLPSRT